MGTNPTGCTEWERDFDPMTEQPTPSGTDAFTLAENARVKRVDMAIAQQLSASIARNSRMIMRLRRLYHHTGCPLDVRRALDSILIDEEPPWHEGGVDG
jgi:hypothetical protein